MARTISRNAAWAQIHRARLIVQLGGRCAWCGTEEDLTIDHIYGRNWSVRMTSSDQRVRRYEREARQGKIQILCNECNLRKRWQGDECAQPF